MSIERNNTKNEAIPRACVGLSLRNRAFKSKRAFGQKLHF